MHCKSSLYYFFLYSLQLKLNVKTPYKTLSIIFCIIPFVSAISTDHLEVYWSNTTTYLLLTSLVCPV